MAQCKIAFALHRWQYTVVKIDIAAQEARYNTVQQKNTSRHVGECITCVTKEWRDLMLQKLSITRTFNLNNAEV